MNFIHDDFLLSTPVARRLYHEHAAPEPILDFHCHLSPGDIASDRIFRNLFEIWLEGDHYKWRAMRASGIDERFVTGDAPAYEKFYAWAATAPRTLRNPLYHWTALELARYFDIDEPLNEGNAQRVWDQANERLATPEYSTQGILKKFRVTALCTTDDPADDLAPHQVLAASALATTVLPAFRPDKALAVHQPGVFKPWLARLAKAVGSDGAGIDDFTTFLDALRQRVDFFHARGCRLCDHGLETCPGTPCTESEAAGVFKRAVGDQAATRAEQDGFAAFVLGFLGRLYAEKGWTMQLHLGALRNNNGRGLARSGPDTGYDSIGDFPQAATLAAFLDRLDRDDQLPKTIIYNLNPADNYVIAAMIGNFQDGVTPGKVQMGAGWWFLDQKEAMEWQLNALSNNGLLSRFVGMVTDSRSFMSYPRHEYFRRTLCRLLGRDVANGELPDDDALLGPLVRGLCHANAHDYLRLPMKA